MSATVEAQAPKPKKKETSAWETAKMLAAGGTAGAISRTATAPLDRIKLLFQVQNMPGSGAKAGAYTGIGQAGMKILREEGFLSFWKGNGANVIRVFPYAAAQLATNDLYKRLVADYILHQHDHSQPLPIFWRLFAGACAGMTATALTHPLDTLRLRMALPGQPKVGLFTAFSTVSRTEGIGALYKGLVPTLVGIAPYAAINFASYDVFKRSMGELKEGILEEERRSGQPRSAVSWLLFTGPWSSLAIGGMSGTLAATACYPLDTVRRRMQMKNSVYKGQLDALTTIAKTEGIRGFYRGWAANTLKVVPQNAIRMASYEVVKKVFGVQKAATDS